MEVTCYMLPQLWLVTQIDSRPGSNPVGRRALQRMAPHCVLVDPNSVSLLDIVGCSSYTYN